MTTITMNKKILENALATTTNFMANGDSSLANKITISSVENTMSISTTDYIESIIAKGIEYNNDDITSTGFEPFSIDGKKLLTVIKSAKTELVTLIIEDGKLTIKAGRSKVKIDTIEEVYTLDIKSEGESIFIGNLEESFSKVFHSIDSNNPKFELNGVNISLNKGSLSLVSTDTRRLSVVEQSITEGNDFDIIIPKDGIKSISSLFGGMDVEAKATDVCLTIETKAISYSVKLINGKFPNWNAIIPKQLNKTVSCKRTKLLELVKEVSLFNQEIAITIASNTITLQDLEGNTETVEPFESDVEMSFGINAKSVIEFLSSYKEESVEIGFNEPNLPMIFSAGNGYREVIMPVIRQVKEVKAENEKAA